MLLDNVGECNIWFSVIKKCNRYFNKNGILENIASNDVKKVVLLKKWTKKAVLYKRFSGMKLYRICSRIKQNVTKTKALPMMLGITFSSKIVEGKSLHEIPVHSSLTQDSSSSSGPLLGGKALHW